MFRSEILEVSPLDSTPTKETGILVSAFLGVEDVADEIVGNNIPIFFIQG